MIHRAHQRRPRQRATSTVALAGAPAPAAQTPGSKNRLRAGVPPEFAYPRVDQRGRRINAPPPSMKGLHGQVVFDAVTGAAARLGITHPVMPETAPSSGETWVRATGRRSVS